MPLKLTLCSLTLRLVKTKRGLLKEYVHTTRAGEGPGLLGAGADGGLPARGKRSLHISDRGFKTRLHLPLTSSSPRVVCLRHQASGPGVCSAAGLGPRCLPPVRAAEGTPIIQSILCSPSKSCSSARAWLLCQAFH